MADRHQVGPVGKRKIIFQEHHIALMLMHHRVINA
jgi:hypothetical protein